MNSIYRYTIPARCVLIALSFALFFCPWETTPGERLILTLFTLWMCIDTVAVVRKWL
jgi:hypothetical protein